MQIQQPSSQPQPPLPKLLLNLIPVYSPANQSELKCHFRVRRMYQPRSESIETFMQRVLKFWGLESKVAYMQLSNVFRDEQVEYCIGLMFDEDAYRIVRDNVVFRLQDKKGTMCNYKPIPCEIFQRYLEKNQVIAAENQTYLPPLEPIKSQKPQLRKIAQENSNTQVYDPKKYTTFNLLFIPEGVNQSDIRSALKALRIQPELLRQRADPLNPCYQLVLPISQSSVLEQVLDINGYPCLVLPTVQPSSLGKLLAEYQLRVTSNRSTSMLTAYAQLKRHGKVLYMAELASGKWTMVFGSKAVVEKLLKMDSDFKMETVKEAEAVQARNLKVADKFYQMLRGKKDRNTSNKN